jgi:hypothetical protein
MTRGAIWVIWKATPKIMAELARSVESVRKQGLGTCLVIPKKVSVPFEVDELTRFKPQDIRRQNQNRTVMYELSPWDTTLHLDSDTLVLNDVSFGFEAAERFGLVATLAPQAVATINWKKLNDVVCDDSDEPKSPLQRVWELGSLPILSTPKAVPNYNCGAFFFQKCDRIQRLFGEWHHCNELLGGVRDQRGFAAAVWRTGVVPYILPPTWNLRAHMGVSGTPLSGPIRIWHSRCKPRAKLWNSKTPHHARRYDLKKELCDPGGPCHKCEKLGLVRGGKV